MSDAQSFTAAADGVRLNILDLDSLDVKVLALTRGVGVDRDVDDRCAGTWRLSRDPLQCGILCLGGGTVIHLAESGPAGFFRTGFAATDRLALVRNAERVADVALPQRSKLYRQQTSRGVPFRGLAALQGEELSAATPLDDYRAVKFGLASIYECFACAPPGRFGLNVCLCRDTWNHRRQLLSAARAADDA